jgi:hypothetical protein
MSCKVGLIVQESLPDLSTTAAAVAKQPVQTPHAATVPALDTPGDAQMKALRRPGQGMQPNGHTNVSASAEACPQTESGQDASMITNATPAPTRPLHNLPSSEPGTTAPDLACPLDLTTPATPPNLHAARRNHSAASSPPIDRPDAHSAPQAEGRPAQGQLGPHSKLSPIQEKDSYNRSHFDRSVHPHTEGSLGHDVAAANVGLGSRVEGAVAFEDTEEPSAPAVGVHGLTDGRVASALATTRSAFSQHLVKLAQELEGRGKGVVNAGNFNSSGDSGLRTPGVTSAGVAAVETVSMRPPKHDDEFWASQRDGEFGADDDECLATPPDARPPTSFPGL